MEKLKRDMAKEQRHNISDADKAIHQIDNQISQGMKKLEQMQKKGASRQEMQP